MSTVNPLENELQSDSARRAEDAEAIRRLVGPEWAAAWAARNAAAIAEFYDEDAVLQPQNELPIVGKAAIQSDYEAFLEEFSMSGSSEIVDLEVGGDWAFMRGTYTTTVIRKKGGQPIDDRGNWFWIVKRQPDNSWKIFRAIGASEPPSSGEVGRDASG